MNIFELVNKILNRLDFAHETYFTYDQVAKWPQEAFNQLVAAKFLQPAEIEANIICDGCDEHCLMEVTVIPPQFERSSQVFVHCDKEANMGRIPIEERRLQRWTISSKTLAECIGRLLRLPVEAICQRSQQQWHIGIYQGTVTRRPLILDFSEGVALLLAGHNIPLIDCIDVIDGEFSINKNKLNKLVANPKGTDETPQERKARLHARENQLKAKGIHNFLEVLAAEEGVTDSAIKKVLYRKSSSVSKTNSKKF